MCKLRLIVFVAAMVVIQANLSQTYAGTAQESLGEITCIESQNHCSSCSAMVNCIIHYAWSSAPVEQSEQEYTRYYTERRCRAEQGMAETIHEQYSVGQSVEKAHSWGFGLNDNIIISEILNLGLSLTHTNSLNFTCNATHEHSHDWTLNYTKPAGRAGYFKHNYVITGDDYMLYTVSKCVNIGSGHETMHTGTTHGRTLGQSYPKLRNRYLKRDVEQFTFQNADCTACKSASMYCNGTSCTYEDDCGNKCEHND